MDVSTKGRLACNYSQLSSVDWDRGSLSRRYFCRGDSGCGSVCIWYNCRVSGARLRGFRDGNGDC